MKKKNRDNYDKIFNKEKKDDNEEHNNTDVGFDTDSIDSGKCGINRKNTEPTTDK